MTRYARARDLAGQLNQALRSRAVMDQALGIIMAESKIDAERAFAVLSRASNNRRMKLKDLAAEIVTRVSGQAPAEVAGEPRPDPAPGPAGPKYDTHYHGPAGPRPGGSQEADEPGHGSAR